MAGLRELDPLRSLPGAAVGKADKARCDDVNRRSLAEKKRDVQLLRRFHECDADHFAAVGDMQRHGLARLLREIAHIGQGNGAEAKGAQARGGEIEDATARDGIAD